MDNSQPGSPLWVFRQFSHRREKGLGHFSLADDSLESFHVRHHAQPDLWGGVTQLDTYQRQKVLDGPADWLGGGILTKVEQIIK